MISHKGPFSTYTANTDLGFMEKVFTFLGLSLTSILGIACLLCPKKVQRYAIKLSKWSMPNNIFFAWMQTESYLAMLKGLGFIMGLAVIFVIYILSTQ